MPRFTTEERQQLAATLGPWTVEPEREAYEKDARITLAYSGPEPLRRGAKLSLVYDTYSHKNQLHCYGSTSYWDDQEHHVLSNFLSGKDREGLTSINLSSEKSVAQVAKDLQRRLVTPYLAIYERFMVALAEAKEKHRQQQALTAEIAALLPDARVSGGKTLLEESRIYVPGCPSWRISYYGITVEHCSVNAGRARLLAALMASKAWQNARE